MIAECHVIPFGHSFQLRVRFCKLRRRTRKASAISILFVPDGLRALSAHPETAPAMAAVRDRG
jgi:hypothetical protein